MFKRIGSNYVLSLFFIFDPSEETNHLSELLNDLLKEIIFPADGSVLVSQKGEKKNTGEEEGGCCGCCRANL